MEGDGWDTSLFPESVRLPHSMEVLRGCGEHLLCSCLAQLTGVPGFRAAA